MRSFGPAPSATRETPELWSFYQETRFGVDRKLKSARGQRSAPVFAGRLEATKAASGSWLTLSRPLWGRRPLPPPSPFPRSRLRPDGDEADCVSLAASAGPVPQGALLTISHLSGEKTLPGTTDARVKRKCGTSGWGGWGDQ